MCNTPGYCLRGTSCVSNDTIAACGASCATCTQPENGTATCNGTACVYMCGAAFHLCPDNTCAANTNTTGARCTSACTQCPGNQDCIDNVCTPPGGG